MLLKNLSKISLSLILFILHLSSGCSTITYTISTPSLTTHQQFTDPAYTDDTTFEIVGLDNQNFYRVEHGAKNFTWSTSLASSSLAWGKQCIWTHSNAATGQQLPYGENVFGGYSTLADGIDGWGLERVNYNWNNPGFSESTGHFTQILWKASLQVGCSRTLCSPGWWVVCHYFPPGNVLGIPNAFTDNVGKQISGSPSVGAAGTSTYVLPSSPVTDPQNPAKSGGFGSIFSSGAVTGMRWGWARNGGDVSSSNGGEVADMLAFLLAWTVVLLVLWSLIWLVEC